MKFGQLIEFNMRNIFVEKSYTKCDKKLFPDPYIKIKIDLNCLWINSVKLKFKLSVKFISIAC